MNNNSSLENILGYEFKDKKLLNLALTHSSSLQQSSKKNEGNNERLEFLGDAYLDAIIGHILYDRMSEQSEGTLSKLRSYIVCEKTLAQLARKLNLGDFIILGPGEKKLKGNDKDSILADSLEAVIGAVIIDGGYDRAYSITKKIFMSTIDDALEGRLFMNYKSLVQEELQKKYNIDDVKYIVDKMSGPDHDKIFYVHLEIRGIKVGFGKGRKKKDAEQMAAKSALEGGLDNVL